MVAIDGCKEAVIMTRLRQKYSSSPVLLICGLCSSRCSAQMLDSNKTSIGNDAEVEISRWYSFVRW